MGFGNNRSSFFNFRTPDSREKMKDQESNHIGKLTDPEKEELMLAYDESFDEANLISHELVKKQHEKWLKK